MDKKLGVYICACGGNISDYVDIEKVKEAIKDEDCVLLARTTMFACGDSNQKDMEADIKDNNLSGIVVASCSPKLHLTTFRSVSERAGLNKYNYVHANIREQASWAHSDNKQGATEKAIHLVKAAIAKARFAKSLEPTKIKSQKSVAVIGAGVAGIKASIALSNMGDSVYLIEREGAIGGKLASLGKIFPGDVKGGDMVERLNAEVKKDEKITLFTNTTIKECTGNIGDFKIKLQETKNGESSPDSEKEINVGSILVATGFESYNPNEGEYGYKEIDNVITLSEFRELLKNGKEGKNLIFKNRKVREIAFIYCVGSRQIKGENKYCSRYCCSAAIQSSLDIKEQFSDIQVYHFTKGVRTYGAQELKYTEASRSGDIFIQFPDKEEPVVYSEKGQTLVKAKDILSSKKEVEAAVDLVVLVTGMVPDSDKSVGSLLKLPRGRDNFFNEIHMKLRPVETVIDGITIAGTCQGPKGVMESVNSALSAAVKTHSFVSKGELELSPIVAYTDANTCEWCGACSEACPYNAISKNDVGGKTVAVINKTTCKGCGMCLPVCESDSIELTSFTNREIESMIEILAN
ncbi:MAG: CoB--CoM heterodisulfide reductase iron-sulfur subunit A family protein [Bacteroidales bacterium]|nr:CoB--CoM heterodisulfide reductase iron-sulfur subunit A family protein [Bacteroidales bacterium]